MWFLCLPLWMWQHGQSSCPIQIWSSKRANFWLQLWFLAATVPWCKELWRPQCSSPTCSFHWHLIGLKILILLNMGQLWSTFALIFSNTVQFYSQLMWTIIPVKINHHYSNSQSFDHMFLPLTKRPEIPPNFLLVKIIQTSMVVAQLTEWLLLKTEYPKCLKDVIGNLKNHLLTVRSLENVKINKNRSGMARFKNDTKS